MRIDLKFDVQEKDGEFVPIGLILSDQRVSVTLSTSFKISKELGLKDRDVREWWQRLEEGKHVVVPGLGDLHQDPDDWFRLNQPIEGEPDEITDKVVAAGEAVFDALTDYM